MYYFVTLLFVILSAKASFFDVTNMCWVIIDIIFLWVGFKKARFHKSDVELFGKFSLIYITFCTLRSVFLIHLPASYYLNDVLFLFKYVFTSFLFCAVLRDQAIYYLTKVIFQLAILSLPLYCLQLVAGDAVYALGKAINLPDPHFSGYVNFLIFTYVKLHHIRNSGFSWEPGAFGFFLNLGLLMHLVTNNFNFDKRAKWIMLAIVTTLSTTTYVAFAFIILLYFRGRGVKFITVFFFIGPILCVLASMMPFMFDKIVATYNNDLDDMKNIQTLSDWYIQRGETMPLNRFASILYLAGVFGYNLIWGVSNIYNETIPLIKHLNLSNGIFAFMAQFGGIGLCFLMYRCYLFFKKNTCSIELSIYSIMVILISGFGEGIFVTSIILCFLFLYHYSVPWFTNREVEFDPVGPRNSKMVIAE
ncbi:hypothetical protein [Mucilaginibacter sp.]|uniref:hypothetical protein n=1 Tax=Mucilaginibacter sp. TaxID=1882438 RepID=UPI002628EC1B|nr:hypothetical protein [Mucilaginibacter sp.]MDB5030801.1 hypothetical protein [Mucilaginibacter sp.]